MSKNPIYDRRSIRKFLNKEVSPELIRDLIAAGSAAPSAKNRQPWKYIAFGGQAKAELLQAMAKGLHREEHGSKLLPQSGFGIPDAKNTLKTMEQAPVIIVVLNTNGASPFEQLNVDQRITEICDSLSIGASIQNMLLRAEKLGLGSLWIANTCFAYTELTAYLHTDRQLIGAVAIGYAAETPAARPRKRLEDILEYRLE